MLRTAVGTPVMAINQYISIHHQKGGIGSKECIGHNQPNFLIIFIGFFEYLNFHLQNKVFRLSMFNFDSDFPLNPIFGI